MENEPGLKMYSLLKLGFSSLRPVGLSECKSYNGSSKHQKNGKIRHHDLRLPPPFLGFDLSHKSQPGIEPRFHLGETRTRDGGASKNLGPCWWLKKLGQIGS